MFFHHKLLSVHDQGQLENNDKKKNQTLSIYKLDYELEISIAR